MSAIYCTHALSFLGVDGHASRPMQMSSCPNEIQENLFMLLAYHT
jgi:hypothetical protein